MISNKKAATLSKLILGEEITERYFSTKTYSKLYMAQVEVGSSESPVFNFI